MSVEAVHLLLKGVGDIDDDVGPEGVRALEVVREIEENRVAAQRRSVADDVGYLNHVGRVLDEDAGVAMVGMVVVGAMSDDHISLPLADGADDLAANVEGRREFPVVILHHLVLGDAEAAGGLLRFGATAVGQDLAAHFVVAGIAIGDADEFHLVAHFGEHHGGAAELDVAVVGMGPDGDDAERLRGETSGQQDEKK